MVLFALLCEAKAKAKAAPKTLPKRKAPATAAETAPAGEKAPDDLEPDASQQPEKVTQNWCGRKRPKKEPATWKFDEFKSSWEKPFAQQSILHILAAFTVYCD